MSIWIAIAARAPEGAKTRLSAVASPDVRAGYARQWFEHVLNCALAVVPAHRVLLVSCSATLRDYALAVGACALADKGQGLNEAFLQAADYAAEKGGQKILTLHADLPLLSPDDLNAMIAAGETADMVIAPDRHGAGTNALLRALPVTTGYHHGEGSFEAHYMVGEKAGLKRAVLKRDGLAVDVDTPEDLSFARTLIR